MDELTTKSAKNSLSTNIDKITLLIHDTLFRIHSRGDGVINDKMKQCIFLSVCIVNVVDTAYTDTNGI